MTIRSINEPQAVGYAHTLTPDSVNQPRPLPEGPPEIEGLNPDTAISGEADTFVVVHGKNFIPLCTVIFNGVPMLTNYESDTKLNFSIPPTEAGEYAVVVQLGQYASDESAFTFTSAEPEPEPEEEPVPGDTDDPDELEDEIEAAKEEGDFVPTHSKSKPKRKR